MKNQSPVFLRQASRAAAPLGVLAFWVGMVMAALRYPSEYDWRYMPVSHLLSPVRDPAGYPWAWAGIVLYSLCGLYWTALLARRWNQGGAENRLGGIRALRFGYVFTIGAAVLPQWLLRIERGHELLTVLAFACICSGMVRLMFQTIERTLMRRVRWFTGHARLYAGLLASAAVLPIVLAAVAQAYVHYAHPELRWVNLSWRDRGVPVYLSFDFWEWITCVVLSVYTVILSLAIDAYPTGKTGERENERMKKPDPRLQIEQSGLFKQDSFDWIVAIIMSNKEASYGSIDRKIRASGELLSVGELEKLGLRAQAKVGRKYYEALSEKGKTDILGSAFLVTERILHAESIFSQYEQIRTSVPHAEALYEAAVVIPSDGDDEGGHACNAARDLQGRRFSFSEVPDLPLPQCDSDHCRCMLRYHRK